MKNKGYKTVLQFLVASLILASTNVAIFAQGESSAQESSVIEESQQSAAAEEVSQEATSTSSDWSPIQALLEENFKPAAIEAVYKSDKPFVFDNGANLISRLDRYALFELTDFNRDFSIYFDDHHDKGALLVFEVTLENKTDKDAYYSNTPLLQLAGYNGVIMESNRALGDENELYFDGYKNDMKLAPGQSQTGYLVYTLAPEAMSALEKNATIQVEFYGYRNQREFVDAEKLMDEPVFNIPFSEEAAAQSEATSAMYPDTVIEQNYGEKEMLESNEELNASQEEEKLVVTVDGYQIARLIPNADYEVAVAEIAGGVILVNVKVTVKNNSDKAVALGRAYSNLVLGDLVQMMNDRSFEKNDYELIVEPGAEGTVYHVFSLEGELYEKFKDDSFVYIPNISNVDDENMHEYQAIAIELK